MTLFRRLFSPDYRAAVSAEAAGNVELAAERYGLAGDRAGAVRMHLARAARAGDRGAEIAALHDARHWAADDPALAVPAAAALGKALYARAIAEGVATARDREKVREAAKLLGEGGEHQLCGEAYEKIGDHQAAAAAYSAAGAVEKVEAALAADDDEQRRAREQKDGFADYETNLRIGRRDDARADLARAVAASGPHAHDGEAGELRRRLDELDARMITGGRVQLRHRRGGATVVLCAAPVVAIGRDALCDLVLRQGGVSRRHSEIEVGGAGAFMLRDAGSRNGTAIGGMPIAGRVPLRGTGSFELGDDCRLDFETVGGAGAGAEVLLVTVATGVDRGARLIAATDGERIELAPASLAGDLVFAKGRPWLGKGNAKELSLDGEPVGGGRVQLIRGDLVVIDGEEVEVG